MDLTFTEYQFDEASEETEDEHPWPPVEAEQTDAQAL
jgi:hypothetical protein